MYYFISYIAEIEDGNRFKWLPENSVINEHPIQWVINCRKDFPDNNYVLLNWKELTETEYNSFKDEF